MLHFFFKIEKSKMIYTGCHSESSVYIFVKSNNTLFNFIEYIFFSLWPAAAMKTDISAEQAFWRLFGGPIRISLSVS